MFCLDHWTRSHHALSFKMPCTAPTTAVVAVHNSEGKICIWIHSPLAPSNGTSIIHGGHATYTESSLTGDSVVLSCKDGHGWRFCLGDWTKSHALHPPGYRGYGCGRQQ